MDNLTSDLIQLFNPIQSMRPQGRGNGTFVTQTVSVTPSKANSRFLIDILGSKSVVLANPVLRKLLGPPKLESSNTTRTYYDDLQQQTYTLNGGSKPQVKYKLVGVELVDKIFGITAELTLKKGWQTVLQPGSGGGELSLRANFETEVPVDRVFDVAGKRLIGVGAGMVFSGGVSTGTGVGAVPGVMSILAGSAVMGLGAAARGVAALADTKVAFRGALNIDLGSTSNPSLLTGSHTSYIRISASAYGGVTIQPDKKAPKLVKDLVPGVGRSISGGNSKQLDFWVLLDHAEAKTGAISKAIQVSTQKGVASYYQFAAAMRGSGRTFGDPALALLNLVNSYSKEPVGSYDQLLSRVRALSSNSDFMQRVKPLAANVGLNLGLAELQTPQGPTEFGYLLKAPPAFNLWASAASGVMSDSGTRMGLDSQAATFAENQAAAFAEELLEELKVSKQQSASSLSPWEVDFGADFYDRFKLQGGGDYSGWFQPNQSLSAWGVDFGGDSYDRLQLQGGGSSLSAWGVDFGGDFYDRFKLQGGGDYSGWFQSNSNPGGISGFEMPSILEEARQPASRGLWNAGVISGVLGVSGQIASMFPGTGRTIGSGLSSVGSVIGTFGQPSNGVWQGLGAAVGQLGVLTGSKPLAAAGQAVSVVAGGLETITYLNAKGMALGNARAFAGLDTALGLGQIASSLLLTGRTGEIVSRSIGLVQTGSQIAQKLAIGLTVTAGVLSGGLAIGSLVQNLTGWGGKTGALIGNLAGAISGMLLATGPLGIIAGVVTIVASIVSYLFTDNSRPYSKVWIPQIGSVSVRSSPNHPGWLQWKDRPAFFIQNNDINLDGAEDTVIVIPAGVRKDPNFHQGFVTHKIQIFPDIWIERSEPQGYAAHEIRIAGGAWIQMSDAPGWNWGPDTGRLHALSKFDINGDGRNDVLVRDWSLNANRGYILMLQNANDQWQQVDGWSQDSPDSKAGTALSVDLDGDGYAESLWKSRLGDVFLAWGGAGGFGEFYEPNNWLVNKLFDGGAFALADIDHDGDFDRIWDGRLIDLNATDRTLNFDIDMWTLGDWTDRQKVKDVISPLARQDLNGDGRLDALVLQWWGDYPNRLVFLQQNDGTFDSIGGWSTAAPDVMAGKALSVDLDGDGYGESVWKSSESRVFLAWGGAGGFGSFYEPNNWLVNTLTCGQPVTGRTVRKLRLLSHLWPAMTSTVMDGLMP